LFDLVMQVLNLGPPELRAIVDRVLGPEFMQMIDKGVAFAEKAFEPISILLTKGPLAFWHYIEETLGSIIQSSFDRIKESVFFAFVEKGIKWIAGFFVPGGGFVKVVKAIVRAFQFVADNLDRIRHFFDSVFDSMEAATQGNTAGVASKIVTGLKAGIVLALGFLARQLGLNTIVDNVHKILHSLRRPIVNAIEWVLHKVKPFVTRIVATTKRLYGKVFQKAKKEDPSDPKQMAGAMLSERLNENQTEEQIQATIKQVASDLKPNGLKRLELKVHAEKEEYEFVAEASPPSVLFLRKFWGRFRKPKVRAVVTLTLTGDQDVAAGIQRTGRLFDEQLRYVGAKRQQITETISYGQLGGVSAQYGSGGVFVRSETGSRARQVQIVTWNTGDPKPGNNPSHAERQFMDWFDSQTPQWRQRVKEVEIYINYSPCPLCVNFLCSWLESHPVSASLRWDNRFYATQDSDVAKLRRCGWIANGP
jgi:hypothetical protein